MLKKILIVFYSVILSFFLFACDDESKSFELSDEIISELKKYLLDSVSNNMLFSMSFYEKVDYVIKNQKMMYVKSSVEDFYYACAYYTDETDEVYFHCDDYIWQGYHKSEDIQEFYNGNYLIAAFQINGTTTKVDLINNDIIESKVEFCQFYEPIFSNGINVESSLIIDESLIYFLFSSDDYIFIPQNYYTFKVASFPCVEINGGIHITHPVSILYSDGSEQYYNLKSNFGSYYEDLMKIMIVNKHSVIENDVTINYGLFEINSFVSLVKK